MTMRKTRGALALAAILSVTALAACGEDSDSTAAPVNATVEGVNVQLLDAGKGPRQPLVWFTDAEEHAVNFSVTQGLEQKTEIDRAKRAELSEAAEESAASASESATDNSDGSSTTPGSDEESGGNSATSTTEAPRPDESSAGSTEDLTVPYEEVTMNLPLTTSITTDGDVRTSEVTVGAPSGTNDERNEDIASAEGFTMTTEQGLDGRAQSRTFAAPDGASDSARASVEQALTKMNDLPIVFPEEPIGTGAQWKVSNRIDEGGVSMLQDITYTLRERQNMTIALGVEVERRPATQHLTGTELKILDVSSESSGQISLNLTHSIPERGSVKVTTTSTYGEDSSAVRVIQKSTSKTTWAPMKDEG